MPQDALVSAQTRGPRLPPPVAAIPRAGRAARTREPGCERTDVTLPPCVRQNLRPRGPRGRSCSSQPQKRRGGGETRRVPQPGRSGRGAPPGNGDLISGDGDGNPARIQTSSTGRGGGRGKGPERAANALPNKSLRQRAEAAGSESCAPRPRAPGPWGRPSASRHRISPAAAGATPKPEIFPSYLNRLL